MLAQNVVGHPAAKRIELDAIDNPLAVFSRRLADWQMVGLDQAQAQRHAAGCVFLLQHQQCLAIDDHGAHRGGLQAIPVCDGVKICVSRPILPQRYHARAQAVRQRAVRPASYAASHQVSHQPVNSGASDGVVAVQVARSQAQRYDAVALATRTDATWHPARQAALSGRALERLALGLRGRAEQSAQNPTNSHL